MAAFPQEVRDFAGDDHDEECEMTEQQIREIAETAFNAHRRRCHSQ